MRDGSRVRRDEDRDGSWVKWGGVGGVTVNTSCLKIDPSTIGRVQNERINLFGRQRQFEFDTRLKQFHI